MKTLYNYFNLEEIQSLIECNSNIVYSNNINKLISILEECNCDNDLIKHVIISNPKYLTNDYYCVVELINKLNEIGLVNLDDIFEKFPYILNKFAFEIDEFLTKRLQNGNSYSDIIDEIDFNPAILDEF